ncbi:MAG: hypothetical protein WC082_04140 [Victivallales bacterium]
MPILRLYKEARQGTAHHSVHAQKNSHLCKKFAKPRFFEKGTIQAQQVAQNFEPSRGSTNAFGRWITEALHPPFFIKLLTLPNEYGFYTTFEIIILNSRKVNHAEYSYGMY